MHGARGRRILPLLGPAFVAAIAYVDPGNVAANITAGSRYGFLLVWVLVMANTMAVVVQYQSAKLGLVTGRTLPELVGERLRRPARIAFWGQAEVVAASTDLAEIIGGAIALNLLFGTPLLLGGAIVGTVSMLMLAVQNRFGQRPFESVIIGLLAIIAIGFVAGVVVNPPAPGDVAAGLVPRFAGPDSVLLATSMLGATVMPHAIYVHSALVRDRFSAERARRGSGKARLLRATRLDVVGALAVAGVVNIAMLVLAAESLRGVPGTDTIEGAHAAVVDSLGPTIGLVFAIGLLASGLASTSVGCYAGATIMQGLLHRQVPLLLRRLITMIPTLVLLGLGVDPTWALVISQVVLSFGIPFALVPLLRLTSDRALMGADANRAPMRWGMTAIVVVVASLNLVLIGLTVAGI
ncbi:Nramp family divalent metal transporter [Pengzhenrongella sicca]|uniref:Nramp family divalent metal transporter n=1 Tax=Pengzhenrongella sicca TaxID=2819238 RepID=A0A8A4ZHR6_9MICO|nr:Nramp family divalent metal transporter [Pengzhenrongella sicca]QTE31600.1 Nramp family divalent metal transporter [Pengzhenrongella sicca]